jgi:hypothetical protein
MRNSNVEETFRALQEAFKRRKKKGERGFK